jgi:4-hydroxybenzoate polyprenyltransferase
MQRLASEIEFILKSSRPGFWLTAIWFYLIPTAQKPVLDTAPFWLGLFFVAFPFGLFIYGWNDIGDAEGDRLNTRKGNFLFGARGTAAQLQRLPWIITAVHLVACVLLTRYFGVTILWWYLALCLATAAYNWPRVGFKRWPVLDMLNQAGYVLVFAMSSIINEVPSASWSTMVFGISFAMHSHLLGQVLDFDVDRLAGRRTTAHLLGVVGSKLVIALFLAAEAALVASVFRQFVFAGVLVCGALWFVADALWLVNARPYPPWLARLFLLGWNAVAAITAPWLWYSGALSHPR